MLTISIVKITKSATGQLTLEDAATNEALFTNSCALIIASGRRRFGAKFADQKKTTKKGVRKCAL